MAKRFVNPDWKALRKLTPNLQRAYFYCWDKADACGVYDYDPIYLNADLGVSISLKELSKLPGAKVLDSERLMFVDFISTNYGTLKDDYNPHKPVFRALSKNGFSSLTEACAKLEDEEEGEDEYKEEGKEEKEDVPASLAFPYDSPAFMEAWGELIKGPKWKRKDKSALQFNLKILGRYSEQVAIDMMEKCHAAGWQGLVEPKNINDGTNFSTNTGSPKKLGTSDARIEALRNW